MSGCNSESKHFSPTEEPSKSWEQSRSFADVCRKCGKTWRDFLTHPPSPSSDSFIPIENAQPLHYDSAPHTRLDANRLQRKKFAATRRRLTSPPDRFSSAA